MSKLPLLTAVLTLSVLAVACRRVGDEVTPTETDRPADTPAVAAVPAGPPLATNPDIVRLSDVPWQQLNPARGDQSPQAGTLWGDRQAAVPTGFLAKFVDGFSSPPHIHNVSYRGVVIDGLVHNDNPAAANQWMPPGSFWTQPKGEVHITSAKGGRNVAYIEIESGPYLVKPADEAFDSGERPVNVDASNLVWLNASNTSRVRMADGGAPTAGPEISFLWGEPEGDALHGALIRVPSGATVDLRGFGRSLRGVVIDGVIRYGAAGDTTLEPGAYFGVDVSATHRLTAGPGTAAVLYVRSEGRFDVLSGL